MIQYRCNGQSSALALLVLCLMYLMLGPVHLRINTTEAKYYADGEDAYDMRKELAVRNSLLVEGPTKAKSRRTNNKGGEAASIENGESKASSVPASPHAASSPHPAELTEAAASKKLTGNVASPPDSKALTNGGSTDKKVQKSTSDRKPKSRGPPAQAQHDKEVD